MGGNGRETPCHPSPAYRGKSRAEPPSNGALMGCQYDVVGFQDPTAAADAGAGCALGPRRHLLEPRCSSSQLARCLFPEPQESAHHFAASPTGEPRGWLRRERGRGVGSRGGVGRRLTSRRSPEAFHISQNERLNRPKEPRPDRLANQNRSRARRPNPNEWRESNHPLDAHGANRSRSPGEHAHGSPVEPHPVGANQRDIRGNAQKYCHDSNQFLGGGRRWILVPEGLLREIFKGKRSGFIVGMVPRTRSRSR